MMGIDATFRAEIVLRHARVELIKRQGTFTGEKRDVADLGRHRHRAPHPAIGTCATADGVEAVRQLDPEPHRAAVAGGFHVGPCVHRRSPLHGADPEMLGSSWWRPAAGIHDLNCYLDAKLSMGA